MDAKSILSIYCITTYNHVITKTAKINKNKLNTVHFFTLLLDILKQDIEKTLNWNNGKLKGPKKHKK